MITSFPPNILICTDARYGHPKAFLQEDALQLMVDQLAQKEPDAGWDTHDISQDETVRGRLLHAGDGQCAEYQAVSGKGRTLRIVIGQFDRYGAAEVKEIREQSSL